MTAETETADRDPQTGRFAPGNRAASGARGPLVTPLVRRRLQEIHPEKGRTYAQLVAERLVDDAIDGKPQAMAELLSRIDGKPPEMLAHDDGDGDSPHRIAEDDPRYAPDGQRPALAGAADGDASA